MPISLMGRPSSCAIAIAIPPFALPSSFVEDEPRDLGGLREEPRLLQSVLTRGGVDREQRLVRGPGQSLCDHASHLGKLLHEVLLRVQATRRVDDHDAPTARDAGADGVVGDGGRIRAAGRAHEVGARALRPRLELLRRRCPEGVGGPDHDARTGLVQLVGQLADRRRLAGPVDAHDEDHGRLAAEVERSALERLLEPGSDDALQLVAQLLGRPQAGPAAASASSAWTISTVAGTPTSAAIRSSSRRSQTPRRSGRRPAR